MKQLPPTQPGNNRRLDLSLLTGKITFNDLSRLTDQPLPSQIDSLKEDLLQVEYGEHLLLDVGWYPEFDEEGAFQVVVIEDRDWETPLWIKPAHTLAELSEQIIEAQRELQRLLP